MSLPRIPKIYQGQNPKTLLEVFTGIKPMQKDDILSERELQDQILAEAKTYNWLVFHDNDSRRNNAGFPDLVLVKDGKIIFAELKRESKRAKLRDDQVIWIEELGRASGENVMVAVWRPSDRDRIWAVLSGKEWN